MLSQNEFKGLHRDLMAGGPAKDGGFSVNVSTGERVGPGDPAFMVSRPGSEYAIPKSVVSPPQLGAYASRHSQALSGNDDFMGGWRPHQEENPNVYLDRSQRIGYTPEHSNPKLDPARGNALTSAMDLAHARNQEAVYDARTDAVLPNPSFQGR